MLRGEKPSVLTLLAQRADPDSFDARGIGEASTRTLTLTLTLVLTLTLNPNAHPNQARCTWPAPRAGCGRC